ncbi:para-aminobenzoate synthetase component 1 [Desulfurispira natronophila]|uniref:Para-aminobenzoate synthetase component 1 n=2 Tax=Desulfurispira natronophila TaxID=682562 RepID=A0A7W8DGS9_9BACT|nr:para-aminobenzoate synthetase component 1 [Desulfurispira natronophila]
MYKKIFYTIREHIFYGDTYLLNLTFSTPVKSSWSLEQMYHWARAPFMLLIKDAFICFSPERFVRIKDHQIEAFPMKGTADAWQCNAAQNLLESPKEKAEHAMVVDLLRNDLSRVANHVRVERFRFLEFIHRPQGDLLQTSSHIKGQLPCDWQNSIGDILWELLPAGSVSGTPKRKTSEIIQQVEHHNRGYFTGVFGYFDGESLDSGVLIRFVEKTSDGYLYKSGGGITWESCPHMEYQEMVNKIYVPLA